MQITAAQYEARRRFALAFRKYHRPDLTAVLGTNWNVGLEVHRLTDDQYFHHAVRMFNKRMGLRHFCPDDKRILFNVTGV